MKSFYKLGINAVINANGKMPLLGSLILDKKVVKAMLKASQHYVDLEELMKEAGKVVARITDSKDGCPTN